MNILGRRRRCRQTSRYLWPVHMDVPYFTLAHLDPGSTVSIDFLGGSLSFQHRPGMGPGDIEIVSAEHYVIKAGWVGHIRSAGLNSFHASGVILMGFNLYTYLHAPGPGCDDDALIWLPQIRRLAVDGEVFFGH